MKYLVWDDPPDGKRCHLTHLENVDKMYQLREGISRAKGWPEDASYEMSDNYKNRIRLVDSLINMDFLVVISEKLKKLLEDEKVRGNEFLPVKIINHKKRPTKERYFIASQIEPQDALDQKKSGCDWNEIDPTKVDRVKKLVITPSKIDPNATLFRLKHYVRCALVREDLAGKILSAGITGPAFMELNEYSALINS